jgi:hypothetical protein
VTALKDILIATISFTREGIKIINFDKTHTIIVNVLSASKEKPEKARMLNCAQEDEPLKDLSLSGNILPTAAQ